ncbi:hypothetical protein LCGC14_1412250, partial [marine sediment metagenome]
MKHTKGPWEVSRPMGNDTVIAIHPPHFYFQGKVDKNTEANAQLIASAPELLDENKQLQDKLHRRNMQIKELKEKRTQGTKDLYLLQ